MTEYNAKDRRALERLKLQVDSAKFEAEYHQRIEHEAWVYARSFKEFVAEAWKIYRPNTPMKMNWHHEYIIELLQGVEEGEFPGQWLLINVPPRCTKSSLVMVLFCAWCWTHNPYKQFACFSHSQDFARRDSRETRRLIRSPWYLERWGANVEPTSDGDQVDKFVNTNGGQRICYGISQNFVGVNADCLHESSLILTNVGWKSIINIHNSSQPVKVLSYNEKTEELEWKRVEASRRILTNTLYNIKSNNRILIKGTGNHRLYTNSGVQRISEIEVGNSTLWTISRNILEMFQVPSGTEKFSQPNKKQSKIGNWEKNALQNLCTQGKKNLSNLSTLWQSILERRFNFFDKILWSSVQKCCENFQNFSKETLRELWYSFSNYCKSKEILQRQVLCAGTFNSNVGWTKYESQRKQTTLWEVVPEIKKIITGSRWQSLCSMPRETDTKLSSCRSKQNEQQYRELSNPLWALPYAASQFFELRFDSIECVSNISEYVYDIQVEGNRNFFVKALQGDEIILSHNCILNDDLNDPKSLSEAKRETVAEAVRSGVITRFNDFALGTGISIQQRVHLEDATGVLKELYGDSAHLIKIPMRYEGQKYICPTLQLEDPRTEIGSLLWPEHIPEKAVKILEKSLGQWGAAAQLQQEPIPTGGGLVKERDFRLWPEGKELPEFDFTILSLDPAFSERDLGKGDSFNPQRSQSAFTYWGAFRYTDPETGENRDATLLIDSLADWMGFPELRKESARLYKKFQPDTFLVENKAAGISLIQDFARAGIYISPFNPMKMDKLERLMLAVPYIQEGNIFFIDNIQNRNTIAQLCSYPKCKLNDRVDSASQALLFLLRMGLNYLPEDEEEEEEENERFAQMNTIDTSSRLPWSY